MTVLAEQTRQDSEVKALKSRVVKLEAMVAEAELHKVSTAKTTWNTRAGSST